MNLKEFLKKYSTISNEFIDDFFSIYDYTTLQTDFIIDVDKIAIWLGMTKGNIKKTLVRSYTKNIDYKISYTKKINNRGGLKKEKIIISPDTFKLICMQSNSEKGAEVRLYYLELENLIIKYRGFIIDGLKKRIKQLENNQSPYIDSNKGVIYIFRATKDENDSLYKIGKTMNIKNRMKNYNSGNADNLELLFIFEVDDIDTIEKCTKTFMKKYQYRKYKEVYRVNINIIKSIIKECDNVEKKFRKPDIPQKQLAGNLYMVMDDKN